MECDRTGASLQTGESPGHCLEVREVERVSQSLRSLDAPSGLHQRSTEPVVRPGIKDELQTLRYPLYFADFETVSPAIPGLQGCARTINSISVERSCAAAAGRSTGHLDS